jgi:hypothetical protein
MATLADACDELKAKIDTGKLTAEPGKPGAACIEPGTMSGVTSRSMSALADRTPVPMPDYCYELATGDGTWWMTRTDACAISVWTLTVYDIRTGEPMGGIGYLQADLLYTGADAPYWAHQVAIDKTDGWGTVEGTTISGSGSCAGDCTLAATDIDFPTQPVNDTGLAFGDILPKTTVATPGDIGTGRTTVSYRMSNSAWSLQPSGVTSTPPFDVRCDNAVPGVTAVGCVMPDYEPVNVVSLSGPYPSYARHLRDAQASGLPGAYPDGQPLHRRTDNTQANRDVACPQASKGGYTRPTGFSCDEYPFASTHEGAASNPTGGRTFSWCQIPQLSTTVTGAGWSACMIDANENTAAGRDDLNPFYKDNRVIENDAFHVWIVD